MSKIIAVRELIGDACITLEQGEPIYAEVYPALTRGEDVTIDFGGVKAYASPFLNAAIGRLLKDFSEDDLRRLLHLENLTSVASNLLMRVIENSNRYYHDPNARKALDDILDEEAEDN